MKRKVSVLLDNIRYHRRKLFYPKSARVQRQRLHNTLIKSGPNGMTRDELVVATGIPLQSVTWRVRELIKQGIATDAVGFGRVTFRETRAGGMASVLHAC